VLGLVVFHGLDATGQTAYAWRGRLLRQEGIGFDRPIALLGDDADRGVLGTALGDWFAEDQVLNLDSFGIGSRHSVFVAALCLDTGSGSPSRVLDAIVVCRTWNRPWYMLWSIPEGSDPGYSAVDSARYHRCAAREHHCILETKGRSANEESNLVGFPGITGTAYLLHEFAADGTMLDGAHRPHRRSGLPASRDPARQPRSRVLRSVGLPALSRPPDRALPQASVEVWAIA